MTAIIPTFGLCKRFGGSRGIEDLALTIRRGEVFGFLGPDRAGKTTTYGSAIQDGVDVAHMAGLTIAAVALALAGAQLFERRDVL